jgi:hypothetical protein
MSRRWWYQAFNRATGATRWFKLDSKDLQPSQLGDSRALADYYAGLYQAGNIPAGWTVQFVGQTDQPDEEVALQQLVEQVGTRISGQDIPLQTGGWTTWAPPTHARETMDTLAEAYEMGGPPQRPPGTQPVGMQITPEGMEAELPAAVYQQAMRETGRPIGAGSGIMGAYRAQQMQPFRRAWQAAQALAGSPAGGTPRPFYSMVAGTTAQDLPLMQRRALAGVGQLQGLQERGVEIPQQAAGRFNPADAEGIRDVAALFRASKITQIGSGGAMTLPSTAQALSAYYAQPRGGQGTGIPAAMNPYDFFRNFYQAQAYTQPSPKAWTAEGYVPVTSETMGVELEP